MNHTTVLKSEILNHLTQKIIPFWQRLKDKDYGGYYGYMDFDGVIDKKAVKGCILNSRILWFFSNAAMTLNRKDLLEEADHAYAFLAEHCLDKEYGGIYWSMTYDGQPEETMKHTYNQAFAIYALSSYYDASKKEEALNLAWKLFCLIEEKCTDEKGYVEAFARDFTPENNEKLSENGILAEKTMNTLLHLLEAYTELYRVTKNDRVKEKLYNITQLFAEKIYNPKLRRQEVFFDRDWHSLIDLHSYGHDIETAWLLDRTCEVLSDESLTVQMRQITKLLAEEVYRKAYKDHSVLNEAENGQDNTTRVWWIQAEAMVGFYNAWEKDVDQEKYLQAVIDIWEYVKAYLIDQREHMEWFWEVNEEHLPANRKPIVEPWKCPYHNGRMCLELLRRT